MFTCHVMRYYVYYVMLHLCYVRTPDLLAYVRMPFNTYHLCFTLRIIYIGSVALTNVEGECGSVLPIIIGELTLCGYYYRPCPAIGWRDCR